MMRLPSCLKKVHYFRPNTLLYFKFKYMVMVSERYPLLRILFLYK